MAGGGRGNTVRANAVETGEGSGTASGQDVEFENPGLSRLNSEQWKALLNMLNNQKSGTNERMTGKQDTLHWIIDSGATNHTVGDLKNLQNLGEIPSCPVGLPNGSQAFSTKEGTIKVDEHLTLDNVLYVPGLTCNLISASQFHNSQNMSFNLLMIYELCRTMLRRC